MRARLTLSIASIAFSVCCGVAAAQTIDLDALKKRVAPAAQKAKLPGLKPGTPGARHLPGGRAIAPRGAPGLIRHGIPRLPGGIAIPRGQAAGTPAFPGRPGLTGPRGANLGGHAAVPGQTPRGPILRNSHLGPPPGRGVTGPQGPNAKTTALPRPGSQPGAAGARERLPAGPKQAARGDPGRLGDPKARGPNAGAQRPNVTPSRQSALPRPGSQPPFGRSAGPGGRSAAWRADFQRRYIAPPRSPGPPPGFGIGRTPHEIAFSGVPPLREMRFVSNEVVVQVSNTVPRAQVDAVARQLGISVVDTHTFDAAGRVVYHFRSTGGRNVRDVIRSLEQNRIVASAQPNYVFKLAQSAPAEPPPQGAPEPPPGAPPEAAPASAASESAQPSASEIAARETLPPGDASQYTIEKLHLGAIHREARGRDIAVAVIDSEIDPQHPDLRGAVKERYDATKTRSNPHTHGTGMAGAIVAKAKLLGVAPGAKIIAIKAFGENNASAEATSFQILQGLDYAMRRGVRIINMSFAGPYDVMIERKLRDAYESGIVLVAAAGNAGPKSPPLYPAADPNVIAVTATDAADKPFDMANRGNHIAVAAPGVDILVPAPRGDYQLTTGTSVAAAHVSGVVALLLEKRPALTPDDVRAILTGSAKPILVNDKAKQTGAGLVDPVQALTFDPATADAPQTAGRSVQ